MSTVVTDGYNGGARGGSRHCGGEGVCMRETECIPSGERAQCNHAEANAITSMATCGVALEECLVDGQR